jgi:iron complex outermembrane receptor protein
MVGRHKGIQGFKKHQVAVATLAVLCAGLAQAQSTQEGTLGSVEVVAPAVFGVTQNLGATVGAGALGNVTQKDTPFSSAVVTSEQILEQGSQKLGDLFIQDASVSDNTGANTAWSTYLTVRGMDLDWQNSYRMDGKPFLGYSTTLPYEHFEQVELLKGATGFMYGFGAPGAIVNYVTKKPTDTPTRSVSLGYASSSLVRANADLGGRMGEDGALGYRLNVTREDGKPANGGKLERSSVLLALDAKLSERLSWDFQALYQDRLATDTEPSILMTSYTGSALPNVVKNDQTLVAPGTYTDNKFAHTATGLKYLINPDWQAQTNFSHSYSKTRRNERVLNVLNASGNYNVTRADSGERYQFNNWDAMATGRVQTGTVRHNIVAGVSWQKQMNDWGDVSVYDTGVGTGNLYAQNTVAYYSVGSFDDLQVRRASEIIQRTAFVSDRVELNDRWSVLGGLRWAHYEQNSLAASGAVTSSYEKSGVVTPTLAVMNKLAADTMAYVSYVESLQQGATVSRTGSYTNAGEVLDPLVSKQWELGLKKDSAQWSGTAALFRVEKASEYDIDAGGGLSTKVQSGKSVYQGVEVGGTARLTRQWSVGGDVMLLDAEYVEGSGSNNGNRVAGAPKQVVTAQVAYRVPEVQGLQVRLGAKHTGETPLRASNNLNVDSYTVFSLGATYDTKVQGYATTLRANINNLTDRKYWMYQYANYIKPGDPRTLSVSATLNF